MLLNIAEYTGPLSRTPAILWAAIEEMPDAWLDSKHAPDVVSPRVAVAHLLICEAEESWMDRLRNLLGLQEGFEPGPYAGISDASLASSKSLTMLLHEFETCRRKNLRELRAMQLTVADLEKGITEEDFGTQTAGHLLATWVAHDLYHLGQIFKSYSAIYYGQIGPYQKYLNLPHFN